MSRIFGVALGRSSAGVAVFSPSESSFVSIKRLAFEPQLEAKERVDVVRDHLNMFESNVTDSNVGLYELGQSVPKDAASYNKYLAITKVHGLLKHELEVLFGKERVSCVDARRPYQLLKLKGTNIQVRSAFFERVKASLGSALPLHILPNNTICPTSMLLTDAVGVCMYLAHLQTIEALKKDDTEMTRLREEATQSKTVKDLQHSILTAKTKVVTLELQAMVESRITSVVGARLEKKALKQLPIYQLS